MLLYIQSAANNTKEKKTQKVFERSHRSWKRLIEERDKMANTHTVYVYYYN